MFQSLWVSKTGLDAQETRMQVISNNLANVNTTAFKQDRPVFEDLLYQTIRQPGAQASSDTILPSGFMLGTGVRVLATEKLHSQGNIQNTERGLDIAIQGKGYFQILMPDGEINYTRDGSFQLDADGQIVMSNGNPLEPSMTVPAETLSITVGIDGTVSVLQSGQADPTIIGNIELADFLNPTGLQPVGGNMYVETQSSGTATTGTPGLTGIGSTVGGALETSNVSVVSELINMIEAQRAYEMNSKAISTADQMLQYATQNL